MTVFVRFVPGSEIIGRARILDPDPTYHEEGPEPDLHWRWHPVKYLNTKPIRGVFLRDFGFEGSRTRPRLAKVDKPWELSLWGDHAVLLDAAGRREEAEHVLRRLREENPQQAAGYAIQADLWSREGAPLEQLQRALRLLEEAAARPVLDARDWDLSARLQRVRRALAGR
jgi:hypothetical protein